VVFISALVMIRVADRRFLSNKTAFDALLGFVLASMLARAINGSVAFFPTLGAGFVLVGLHKLLAWIACWSHAFGNLVKGKSQILIRDGEVDAKVMKSNDLTTHDIFEDLHLNGNIDDSRDVKLAFYERNGQITVVKELATRPMKYD
ncbi:MAG TPA: YetF domain-containing protein, partial [Verrucomicrobiae bacterium]|nr:YetF domain-containing protein [Verrucomicrobiae bacterium]